MIEIRIQLEGVVFYKIILNNVIFNILYKTQIYSSNELK